MGCVDVGLLRHRWAALRLARRAGTDDVLGLVLCRMFPTRLASPLRHRKGRARGRALVLPPSVMLLEGTISVYATTVHNLFAGCWSVLLVCWADRETILAVHAAVMAGARRHQIKDMLVSSTRYCAGHYLNAIAGCSVAVLGPCWFIVILQFLSSYYLLQRGECQPVQMCKVGSHDP